MYAKIDKFAYAFNFAQPASTRAEYKSSNHKDDNAGQTY